MNNINNISNINNRTANNTQTKSLEHEETTVTLGIKVGNSYIDTINTITNLEDYKNSLNNAKEEETRIRNLFNQGKASEQALEDAKENVKVAEANLAYATIQSLSSIASSAQTAATSLGTGFYTNAFTNYDTTTTNSNEQSSWQTQGNLISNNGNINFNTTNNMTQEGTNLYAINNNTETSGTINYNIGNDLTIQASKDTYNYKSETKTEHTNFSIGTKIQEDFALNSLNGNINIGAGNNTSKTNSETYNNTEIIANNINITTNNNTDIKGANIQANNNINITTGNNLNIESLQDTYYSNTKDNNWNAELSYSKLGNTQNNQQTPNKISYGANGSGNSTHSITDSKWVNNQTTIIANNNINITTKNNTDLKGSIIASNSDNLNINTGSLTYSDITNFNTTTTKGSGLSTGIGTSADSFFKGTSPNGTTSITHINEGQEKEGTTKATIGKGNITIAGNEVSKTNNNLDLIRDLNRDTNNTQQITKDMITGALNNTLEIDNRVFTVDGWKSIKYDFENFYSGVKSMVNSIDKIIKDGLNISNEDKKNLLKNIEIVNMMIDEEIKKIEEEEEEEEEIKKEKIDKLKKEKEKLIEKEKEVTKLNINKLNSSFKIPSEMTETEFKQYSKSIDDYYSDIFDKNNGVDTNIIIGDTEYFDNDVDVGLTGMEVTLSLVKKNIKFKKTLIVFNRRIEINGSFDVKVGNIGVDANIIKDAFEIIKVPFSIKNLDIKINTRPAIREIIDIPKVELINNKGKK